MEHKFTLIIHWRNIEWRPGKQGEEFKEYEFHFETYEEALKASDERLLQFTWTAEKCGWEWQAWETKSAMCFGWWFGNGLMAWTEIFPKPEQYEDLPFD